MLILQPTVSKHTYSRDIYYVKYLQHTNNNNIKISIITLLTSFNTYVKKIVPYS